MRLYNYETACVKKGDYPFPEIVDYKITVPCLNREDTLIYIFRSYCYGSYLYITDYFPQLYENDSRRTSRFTSHEGYSINMRQLSVTCLAIFVEHFIKNDLRKAMVISGSYQDNENKCGPSRKLKLYQYFFYPLLTQLNLRSVEMMEYNAFILTCRENPISDNEIRQCYLAFRKIKNEHDDIAL